MATPRTTGCIVDGGSFAYSRNGPSNSAEVEEGLSSEVTPGIMTVDNP